ncbi:hypothetical protein GCM10008967_06590 [Bacillus carboniphilus]|uniref:histidine kinase n=1 Tax=Bacillus carboniphilus TaxID=86663 RepID=A0ABN0VVZ5_9BACI
MNFIPDGVILHESGVIHYINNAGVTLFHAESAESLIGESVLELFHSDSMEQGKQRYQQLENGDKLSIITLNIKCLDGVRRQFQLNSTCMCEDNHKLMVTIFRDITQQKQQEEALRESEHQYRMITDNMSDLIAIFDQNGIIKYASPSYENVMGFKPEFYMGRYALDLIHPEDIDYIQERYDQLLQTGEPQRVEFRYQHSEGHYIWLEVIGKVLTQTGHGTDYMVVGREITERKENEALIRKLDKLSAVGQLAAGVGHEIRNPLTSIKGFLQLMEQDEIAYNDAFYWDIIFKELSRIDSIVTEFMFLAKPQAGAIEVMNMNEIVSSTLTLLDSHANLYNVTLTESYSKEHISTSGIENNIKQVLVNIIGNAIESISKYGKVRVRVEEMDSVIRIRVIDTGKGISKERLHNLGTPFYTTKEKGIGLGLTISQKIIKEHRGELRIRSKSGLGTVVDILLPKNDKKKL